MTKGLQTVSEAEKALAAAETPEEINLLRRKVRMVQDATKGRRDQYDLTRKAAKFEVDACVKAGKAWAVDPERATQGSGMAKRSEKMQNVVDWEKAGFFSPKDASMCEAVAHLDPEDVRVYKEDVDAPRHPSLGGLYAVWRLFYGPTHTTGPIYVDNEGTEFGFWALERPLTATWGSGDVWKRMVAEIGDTPDVAFGRTDQIPGKILAVDRKTGHEWAKMPEYKNSQFRFGYWDPPYDSLYKPEAQEIWRTVRKLAILHTHVYPRAWLEAAKRKGMYAVTMGPMKQMRCLQVFEK